MRVAMTLTGAKSIKEISRESLVPDPEFTSVLASLPASSASVSKQVDAA